MPCGHTFSRIPAETIAPGQLSRIANRDVFVELGTMVLQSDNSSAMAADIKGPHSALAAPARRANGMPALRSLIITARLSDGIKEDAYTASPRHGKRRPRHSERSEGRLRHVEYFLSYSLGFAVLHLIGTPTQWRREYLPFEPNKPE
jgi:hypothetical protein